MKIQGHSLRATIAINQLTNYILARMKDSVDRGGQVKYTAHLEYPPIPYIAQKLLCIDWGIHWRGDKDPSLR